MNMITSGEYFLTKEVLNYIKSTVINEHFLYFEDKKFLS